MSSRRNTCRQIIEFNRKTFQAKTRKKRQDARLSFEEKIEIVKELNALVSDFAATRKKTTTRKRH